jgi:hypothetical protein
MELQKLFDNYEWPQITDLWIPVVAAIVIGCLEHFTMYLIKDYTYSQQIFDGDIK